MRLCPSKAGTFLNWRLLSTPNRVLLLRALAHPALPGYLPGLSLIIKARRVMANWPGVYGLNSPQPSMLVSGTQVMVT